MKEPLFALSDLRVAFATRAGAIEAVRGIDLELREGECVAIVGESGSGKSQALLGALGLLPANGRASGSARFEGRELIGAGEAELNRLRGSKITMIFQEPMSALDPLYPIGTQIAAPLLAHGGLSKAAAARRAGELLADVGVNQGAARAGAYPHELSGGERQRVMIAMAIANAPKLLIADEPTTALDVTVQARILELLAELRRKIGMAMIFVSHDLGLVGRIADRVYVMREGRIIESGAIGEVLRAPREAYTRALVEAEPEGAKPPVAAEATVLLEARGLRVAYAQPSGLFGRARELVAVDDVSLRLRAGQTLGVVGESGSGKSTLARALLRLVPSEGALAFEGRDLRALDAAALRKARRRLQLVFQDPYGSLSPRLRVGDIVTEGLSVHEPGLAAPERDARAIAALEEVGLDPETRRRTPDAFSGGQRQRIAIARALILKPSLLVLDEPTSALDRTVQRDILGLLRALQQRHGLAYLFITHDLAVVRAMADEVLVMRAGRVIERGATRTVFETPSHAYTRDLITAAYLS